MIKTDVPTYFKKTPGVVIHKNDKEKEELLKQKQQFAEKLLMQEQINNMSRELDEIKAMLKVALKNKE